MTKKLYLEMKKKMFNMLSKKSVIESIKEDGDYLRIWNLSLDVLPELAEHFVNARLEDEEVCRVRMLICAEVYFLTTVINDLREKGEKVENYIDIGDSDGSVRYLLKHSMSDLNMDTLGINLQAGAVEKIRQRGLAAECVDAMHIHEAGRKYDIVSIFETLEHLSNPIGFLTSIKNIVKNKLVISVPLINKSRVNLSYLSERWPKDKVPTIENTHIFELSPKDWRKIFLHSGWRIESQKMIKQFPSRGLLKLMMQYVWRKISFEGFWFVSLEKDDTFSSRYCIE